MPRPAAHHPTHPLSRRQPHAGAARRRRRASTWTPGVTLAAGADDTYTLHRRRPRARPSSASRSSTTPPGRAGRTTRSRPAPPSTSTRTSRPSHGTVTKLYRRLPLDDARATTARVWAYLPPSTPRTRAPASRSSTCTTGRTSSTPRSPSAATSGRSTRRSTPAPRTARSREIIVIGVENTADRIYEYTPTTDPSDGGGGGGDQYLAMLVDELKPQVDSDAAHACPTREHTGILGSSLGGLRQRLRRRDAAPTSSASSARCRRRRGGTTRHHRRRRRRCRRARGRRASTSTAATPARRTTTSPTPTSSPRTYATLGYAERRRLPACRASGRPAQRSLLGAASPRRATVPLRAAHALGAP